MHKIIEERRGHPQGNWGCFALACYAFRRYCRSLQKRNTNINGSCLQKCKFINLHKRATVIKKRKQMKLSYNLFLFPSFLSHCCPQLTRKKGVPPLFFFNLNSMFASYCQALLLSLSIILSINNTRDRVEGESGERKRRKVGGRTGCIGGTMFIKEYIYTFIHGQPAFTEVTLIVDRRHSSPPAL